MNLTKSTSKLPWLLAVGLAALVGLYLLIPRYTHPTMPSVPTMAFERFEPAVRTQLQEALSVVQIHPLDADANGNLGMTQHAYKLHAEAKLLYQRAWLLAPGDFRWGYLLAAVQVALGEHPHAITTLQQALPLQPDYLPARLLLAGSLIEIGRGDEALSLLRELHEQTPESIKVAFELAQLLAARGQMAEAAALYRQILQQAPKFGAAHYGLAQAYRQLGDQEAAVQHLSLSQTHKGRQATHVDPLLAQVKALDQGARQDFTAAEQHLKAGRLRPAIVRFEQALMKDPDFLSAHISLIHLYWRIGDNAKATGHYEAALAINPNAEKAHLNYGILLGAQKRHEEAAESFARVLAINPHHAEAHTFLGFVRETQGRTDDAATHYVQALRNDPNQPRGNFLLGRLRLHAGQGEQAATLFQRALRPNEGTDIWFLRETGLAYRTAGDLIRARDYLERAREQAARQGVQQQQEQIAQILQGLGQP